MTFRTLVMLCLAGMAGGIMTRGASEGSVPSKRSAARHRAAKGSDSGGLWGLIADAVDGLADALDGADEADEMEMHKTSLDVDKDDEEDEEEEEDMTPAVRQTLSALQDFYGEERMEEIMGIMDRGLAPDASEDDKERAKEYLDKTAELAEAAGVSDATSADEADQMEMHKTSLDVDKDDEEDEEEDMTPAELRTVSALRDYYGEERLEEVAGIVDRGMAPDASEDDKERANEYLDKASNLVEAAHASDATSADEGDEMEMHQTSFDEARADREADEVVEHVAHGVGEIVDAVAPLATELLDAVLGDDEDEA